MKILHSPFVVRSCLPFFSFWKHEKQSNLLSMWVKVSLIASNAIYYRLGKQFSIILSLVKSGHKKVSVKPSPVFCILPSSCLLHGSSSSRNQSCSGYIWTVRMHTRCPLHSHGHGSTRTSGRTLKQRNVKQNYWLPLISMYIPYIIKCLQ